MKNSNTTTLMQGKKTHATQTKHKLTNITRNTLRKGTETLIKDTIKQHTSINATKHTHATQAQHIKTKKKKNTEHRNTSRAKQIQEKTN